MFSVGDEGRAAADRGALMTCRTRCAWQLQAQEVKQMNPTAAKLVPQTEMLLARDCLQERWLHHCKRRWMLQPAVMQVLAP